MNKLVLFPNTFILKTFLLHVYCIHQVVWQILFAFVCLCRHVWSPSYRATTWRKGAHFQCCLWNHCPPLWCWKMPVWADVGVSVRNKRTTSRLRLPRDGYSACQTTTRLEMKIPSWYFGFFTSQKLKNIINTQNLRSIKMSIKRYIINSVFLSSDCDKTNYCTSLN